MNATIFLIMRTYIDMVDNSNHASCWILNSMAIQLLATEKIRNFVSLSLDFKKIKHKFHISNRNVQ